MNPLRSGQGLGGQWRRINKQGADGRFGADTMVDTRHQLSGQRRHMMIGGGGGGIIDCGEYDPDRGYVLQNMVSRSTGSNRGTWIYISTTPSTGSAGANPTVDPWVNSNGSWRELFPANTNDQWQ